MKQSPSIMPRHIRLVDAPAYLGMNKNMFNRLVRPYVTEISTGDRCIGFDRLDLDNWFEDHKRRNGRPAMVNTWDTAKSQGLPSSAISGKSTRPLKDMEDFAKALEQAKDVKPKASS